MIIISFDAVSDKVWKDNLSLFPNIAAFEKTAEVFLDVETVFLSNTYPTHCSIATGCIPNDHGLISNTEPFPSAHPHWMTDSSLLKKPALWQTAAEAGKTVASVLWPVTCGSPHIRYNIPEAHIRPGGNQLFANFKAGSKYLQLDMFRRFGKELDGEKQPALDRFTTSCAVDILTRKKPDLTFVHLICYDDFSHVYGSDSEEVNTAFKSLDENLGRLLEAAGEDMPVIIVSDHACLPVHTTLTPNDILVEMGLLKKCDGDKLGYEYGEHNAFIECCGGSAFFHPGSLPKNVTMSVRDKVAGAEGFLRFLTQDEMHESGRGSLPFGYGLKEGYEADNLSIHQKGTHGYPVDMPDYRVFYAIRGNGFSPGKISYGGSILDIAPIAANLMGISS